MCGIFGIITSGDSPYKEDFLSNSFKKLAYLSETRGKDSSGICAFDKNSDKINIIRGPIPVKTIIKDNSLNFTISNNSN